MGAIIIGIIVVFIIFVLAMFVSIKGKDEKLSHQEFQEDDTDQFNPKMEKDAADDIRIAYKLEKTTKYQENIINVIAFDNNATLNEELFKGLSDDEINHSYSSGQQIWQYDDPFGIKNFDVADKISKDGLEVKAQLEDQYITIGFINHIDGAYILKNRHNVAQKRLLYRGGYYKQSLDNKVTTDFENYVLKLAICYYK